MSNPLAVQMQALSRAFAQAIVDAIQKSSLAEIMEVDGGASAPVKRGPGRPAGPARYKLEETVSLVAAYVRSHPGVAADGVRGALGLEKSQWNVAVARAVGTKAIVRKGVRRGARYFAG